MTKKNNFPFVFFLLLLIFMVNSNAYGVIKINDEGNEVSKLQEKLVILGESLSINGYFDLETKEKVKLFQKQTGLTSDGIVGAKTWSKLKELTSFDIYTVKRGDFLSDIAQKHKVTTQQLMAANNKTRDLLFVGEELILPTMRAGAEISPNYYEVVRYRVREGDTLSGLSKRFNVDFNKIKTINNIFTDKIFSGQNLYIPRGILKLESQSYNYSPSDSIEVSSTDNKNNNNNKRFIYPLKDQYHLTSKYGWRIHPINRERHFHNGIDLAANKKTPIYATKEGRVISSGWVQGFGRTITIDHGDGIVSLYAHNERNLVHAGNLVKQGQKIGLVGSSGQSTGPHLHFGIYKNNQHVNPFNYLKK